LRGGDALRHEVREFGAKADARSEIEKICEGPGPATFGIRLRDRRMIAVVRAEDIEARSQAISAEGLRRQRIRRIVRELDPGARREAHARRSPTILCSQRGPVLAVDLRAQQIQFRLPGVLFSIFAAISAIVDVRTLEDGA